MSIDTMILIGVCVIGLGMFIAAMKIVSVMQREMLTPEEFEYWYKKSHRDL